MSQGPDERNNLIAVTAHVDKDSIRNFVTQIKSAPHQVGEHILAALADESVVAVLTAVVVSPDGGQHIVSAGLDPKMLQEVQRLITTAAAERQEEVPCVGFHCLLRPKHDAPS